MSKPRVAFVVQRCGREVTGGAESLCLTIAQRMAAHWQTEVLTTCAVDYVTWANYYPPGEVEIDGTLVRRFPVSEPRDIAEFDRMSEHIRARGVDATLDEQERWMRAQGPWSPDLLEYIETHAGDYDAFFFFGYLYAQCYFGLPKVAAKSIMVPLAHDEWTIHLGMWPAFFSLPRAYVFNTVEERAFFARKFPQTISNAPVIGMAVDRGRNIDPQRFRRDYGIEHAFLLYVGRIDLSKGCGELFDFFLAHRDAGLGPEKLVLVGKSVMPIPHHPDIISLGYVSDEVKWDALAACDVLVMPSPYESLSIAILEAWAVGKPVLVNGRSEVLVGQTRRANGGMWYETATEFSEAIAYLQEGRNPGVLGRQGWRFVNEHYSWTVIEQGYLDSLAAIV